jgi:HCOMODA/2-hydroxy-3-carboxy-muconic semialdehyde decarboxylase
MGSYFAPAVPVWSDPQLLRSDDLAERLAETMGDAPAILMRGNGAVTKADTLEAAVVFTWFLEDAARIELAVRQVGAEEQGVLTLDEARERAVSTGRIFERRWEFLTAGDAEAAHMTAGFRLPNEGA